MKLHQYLLFFVFGTIISATTFLLILLNIDPLTSAWPVYVIFYLSAFTTIVGALTCIGTLVRSKKHDSSTSHVVVASSRQGILLGSLFVICLLFLRWGLFYWWSVLILIFFLSFIEFFILSKNMHEKH